MKRELYLYTQINDDVAQQLIAQMEESKQEGVVLRVNSPGGSVFAAYGICAKMLELGNVDVKVDGAAMSAAANMLMYANSVESLDVAKFLFHRADMIVADPEEQDFLNKVNADLKSKMLSKIDKNKFQEITGVSIRQLFDPDNRVNVYLDAREMKKLGLVKTVLELSPSEIQASAKAWNVQATKQSKIDFIESENNTENKNEIKKSKTNMTLDDLRLNHPDAYKEAVQCGVNKERDRVGAWLAFMDADKDLIKENILKGDDMSQRIQSELIIKLTSINSLNIIKAESAQPVTTQEVNSASALTEAQSNKVIFEERLKKHLKLK